MVKIKRPSKNEYYLKVAKEVASRSTCFRVRIGAVIVRDNHIIATGYVGAPRKTRDCLARGFCLRDKLDIPHGQRYELCRSVHAEVNAIINAARAGVSLLNAEIYLYGRCLKTNKTFDVFPCFFCKRIIINAGLKKLIIQQKNGKIKIFSVKEWVKNWQKKDIINDKYQYGPRLKIYSKKRINKKIKLKNSF